MKPLIILIVLAFLVSSCTNEEKPDEPATVPISRETELKESIKKYPDSLSLKEYLIQYYRSNNNYDMALATANEVLQKDSSLARFWEMKAALYFENYDTVNAIKAYEKLLDIYPAPQYVMELGFLYAATKNLKALEIADLLIIANESNSNKEALFIKGLYYNYTKDKQKAIYFFDECLKSDYTFMLAYREKAIALYDMGKYNDALEVLDKAVTLQNNFDEGYYWRGRCLEKLQKINEAIEEYKTALFYNKDYIEAQDALVRLGVK